MTQSPTICVEDSADTKTRCLNQRERERLLGRIHSALYWVGEFVPDEYEIDGRKIKLRDTIYSFISKDDPTEEEVEAALGLANRLQKEVREREDDLRHMNLSVDDAKELMDEVAGLMRAVDELRHIEDEKVDYTKQRLLDRINDERRWLKFVKEIK
ncbi:MAG: hypothetical protein A4E32_01684 [Methanomassiliicoccales archaeon PtaU1.Bin124]|nr:MAG: hypothetical protein A4E32_01684 [Methanomassiliicoccales archaeon PtaU1.Bin124]